MALDKISATIAEQVIVRLVIPVAEKCWAMTLPPVFNEFGTIPIRFVRGSPRSAGALIPSPFPKIQLSAPLKPGYYEQRQMALE